MALVDQVGRNRRASRRGPALSVRPVARSSFPLSTPRGCYELAASRAAFLSMMQTKATMWRSASVLA